MFNNLKQLTAALTATVFFVFASACGNTVHPGQLSAFDGSTFDAFVTAHAALQSLRAQVLTSFPAYKTQFNGAASSYAAAYNSYVLFRSAPAQNQTQVAVEINNLTVSIVALESALQDGIHATPEQREAASAKVNKVKSRYKANAQSNVSLSSILTELEIAAAVAQTIPGASPYAVLASVIIQATSQAIAAYQAANGQPIDLSAITPVPSI